LTWVLTDPSLTQEGFFDICVDLTFFFLWCILFSRVK